MNAQIRLRAARLDYLRAKFDHGEHSPECEHARRCYVLAMREAELAIARKRVERETPALLRRQAG